MNEKNIKTSRRRLNTSNYTRTKELMYLHDNTFNKESEFYTWKEQKVSWMIWKEKTEEEIIQFIKGKFTYRNYFREMKEGKKNV